MTSPAATDISGVNRFRSLWRRCLIEGASDRSETIHDQLLAAYHEPQRHYHTLAHIEHCLRMLDQCRSLARHPDALEIAIWFHDAVFEPGAPDNEALSAELYLGLSDEVHANELRELVARLVMATLHSDTPFEDSDAKYMIDIDLSSFGLPWEDFERDSQNLRAERPGLSDTEFYGNLADFRSTLLSRESFYRSEYFCQAYEQRAQDNLSRYFKAMCESSSS